MFINVTTFIYTVCVCVCVYRLYIVVSTCVIRYNYVNYSHYVLVSMCGVCFTSSGL